MHRDGFNSPPSPCIPDCAYVQYTDWTSGCFRYCCHRLGNTIIANGIGPLPQPLSLPVDVAYQEERQDLGPDACLPESGKEKGPLLHQPQLLGARLLDFAFQVSLFRKPVIFISAQSSMLAAESELGAGAPLLSFLLLAHCA